MGNKNDSTSISRKDFLRAIGSMAGVAVLAKAVGIKKAASTIGTLAEKNGAYGNSVYGGKRA